MDKGEVRVSVERMEQLRSALESMVDQFASVHHGMIHSHGLSALEEAFEALGIEDPSEAPSHLVCDEPGCGKVIATAWPSETGYRRTCGEHFGEGG